MSAIIKWKFLPDNNKTLNVSAPSSFLQEMEKAFNHSYPWVLTGTDLPVLRGMAAVYNESRSNNPYQQMIDKIENDDKECKVIEVWPEY